MKYLVYYTLTDSEIIEADSILEVQNKCKSLPYRIVPVDDDGRPKLPEGFEYVNKNE